MIAANTLTGYLLVAVYMLPLACLLIGGILHELRKPKK